jgi:hypothetical protein
VLRVKIKILNLYVNAPDTMAAGRSRTFTVSAGEMTMFMELYDSETGAVLARVVDRREGRNTGQMQLSSSVVNTGESADDRLDLGAHSQERPRQGARHRQEVERAAPGAGGHPGASAPTGSLPGHIRIAG